MWTGNYLQNFRRRPLHFLGSVALAMCVAGFLLAVLLLIHPLPTNLAEELDPAPPVLIVGGLVTVLLGLISDRNLHENTEQSKQKPIVSSIGLRSVQLFRLPPISHLPNGTSNHRPL